MMLELEQGAAMGLDPMQQGADPNGQVPAQPAKPTLPQPGVGEGEI